MGKKQDVQGTTLSSTMEGFSTGYGFIDYLSGLDGQHIMFPRGTIVELFGQKSSSKTTVCLETIAFNQMINPNFKVLYADFEKMVRKEVAYLNSLGIETDDPERFKVIEPETMEEGVKYILDVVKENSFDMIIIDTVAAMRPKAEQDNGFGQTKQMGIKAKLMSEFLRNMMADLQSDGPAIIFINQEYKDINNSSFIQTYTTPSSDALKFYSGINIEVVESTKLKDKKINPYTLEEDDIPYGSVIKISTKKNKVGMPFRKSKYIITYGEGIDVIAFGVTTAIKAGVIRNKGASKSSYIFEIDGKEKSVNGMSKLIKYFKENVDDAVTIFSQINDLWAYDMQFLKQRLERKSSMNFDSMYEVDYDDSDAESSQGESSGLDLNSSEEGSEDALEEDLEEALNRKSNVKPVEKSGGLKLSL